MVLADYFPKWINLNRMSYKACIHQISIAFSGNILRAVPQGFQHFTKSRNSNSGFWDIDNCWSTNWRHSPRLNCSNTLPNFSRNAPSDEMAVLSTLCQMTLCNRTSCSSSNFSSTKWASERMTAVPSHSPQCRNCAMHLSPTLMAFFHRLMQSEIGVDWM